MIADYFFIFGFSFLIGSLSFYFSKFWFLINLLLPILFYLKFKNFKISILILLFLFSGSIFYFFREKINFSLKQPEIFLIYRNFVEEKIKESLPFVYDNLLRGILFGSNFEDRELKENFTQSGLLHLTAVSGQNLTIMFSSFNHLFRNVSFLTPNLVFIFSTLIIIFFIFIMGFEGSVIRAAIMGLFLILIRRWGRLALNRNILLLTALIFLFIDPKLLFEIGTQLSFLAMAGILYLAPIFEKKLEFLKINIIKKTLSEILGAQIMTMPLILFQFGNFNIFSILANLFALPLVPYLMQTATIFLFLPIKFLSYLTLPFLFYLYLISKIFSSFGFIYFKIPFFFVILIYFFIFVEIYYRLKDETLDFRLNLK